MKTINWLITVILAFSFVSCTNSDNDLLSESSSFETIKNSYGVEAVPVSLSGTENIPSVTVAEMQAVLEALRMESNQVKICSMEAISSTMSANQNKKVVMGSNYVATTRTGAMIENFLLRVELKFNYDNNQVSYYGTDYLYDSKLFDWRAQGLSLNPVKNGSGLTYEFESESYLYFKVQDEGNCLVKVGLIFKGKFDFKSQTGTYSFQLQKYSK